MPILFSFPFHLHMWQRKNKEQESNEQEEMRRPLVSQAEEGQGKSEVNNSLYSAKTMLASILHLHLHPAPLFSQPQWKRPRLNRYER